LDEFLERKPKSTQNKLENKPAAQNTPAENTSKVKAN